MKKSVKNKVGRPKLASKEQKKTATLYVILSLFIMFIIFISALFTFTNLNINLLKGSVSSYTIKFKNNQNNGFMSNQKVNVSSNDNIKKLKLIKEGYTFAGWKVFYKKNDKSYFLGKNASGKVGYYEKPKSYILLKDEDSTSLIKNPVSTMYLKPIWKKAGKCIPTLNIKDNTVKYRISCSGNSNIKKIYYELDGKSNDIINKNSGNFNINNSSNERTLKLYVDYYLAGIHSSVATSSIAAKIDGISNSIASPSVNNSSKTDNKSTNNSVNNSSINDLKLALGFRIKTSSGYERPVKTSNGWFNKNSLKGNSLLVYVKITKKNNNIELYRCTSNENKVCDPSTKLSYKESFYDEETFKDDTKYKKTCYKVVDKTTNKTVTKCISAKIDTVSPTTWQLDTKKTSEVVGVEGCGKTFTGVGTYKTKKGNESYKVTKHTKGNLVYSQTCKDETSGIGEKYISWDLSQSHSKFKETQVNTAWNNKDNPYVLESEYKKIANASSFSGSKDGEYVFYRRYCKDKAGNRSEVFRVRIKVHTNSHAKKCN